MNKESRYSTINIDDKKKFKKFYKRIIKSPNINKRYSKFREKLSKLGKKTFTD